MRRILIDHARGHQYAKRGGVQKKYPWMKHCLSLSKERPSFSHSMNALRRLAATDPQKSQVVGLRFFGGLTVPETAEALKLSEKTVMRDWEVAKAWLYRELKMKQ
jgi:RNA polymerase sigma-70 factor, ECF subfamily